MLGFLMVGDTVLLSQPLVPSDTGGTLRRPIFCRGKLHFWPKQSFQMQSFFEELLLASSRL